MSWEGKLGYSQNSSQMMTPDVLSLSQTLSSTF